MKLYAAFSLALMVTLLCSGTTNAHIFLRSPDRDFDADFAKYKSKFLKSYASAAEEAVARKAYEENMQWAAELKSRNPHATFGETAYTDFPRASFKATHHNANFSQHMKNRKPIQYRVHTQGQATAIDWRARGAVTGVKNQQQCGGCWSFSTTGNIEGQWFLAGNPLTSLSEQELLSCDTTGGNNGCDGGLMDYAFQWLINSQQGTIVTASSYPFVSGDGAVPSCSLSGTTPGATISSYNDLAQDESQIAAYVYDNGPVSIGVDAASFQTYTGGILTDCQYNGPNSLDHAVLIVGYDDTVSVPYWIVKNQWGTSWGESGYIRLAKGSNQCGLADAATSSIVSASSAGRRFPVNPPLPPTPPKQN
jgi:C1A family cysteine protease